MRVAKKDNMKFYEAFKAVPEEAKKLIRGGRLKGMTDINPMWRIKRLTEEFGPCGIGWYYERKDRWLEKSNNGEIAAFVEIALYVKIGGEWSKPIEAIGGSMFCENQRNGVYTNDECYKMATTDAISVACKQLGMAADVYFEKDNTKYNDMKRENIVHEPYPPQYQQGYPQAPPQAYQATPQTEEQIMQELREAAEQDAKAEMPKPPEKTPKEEVEERLRELTEEERAELLEIIDSKQVKNLTEYAKSLKCPLDRMVKAYGKERVEDLNKAEYVNAINRLMKLEDEREKKKKNVAKG